MAENKKPIYISAILVKGDILYQAGDSLDLFPEKPFEISLDYKDFQDKEEYVTLMRILNNACRLKL